MKKNNNSGNDKNLIDIHTMNGFEATDERCVPFALRLARADNKTRSRYNAVRNAFAGYVSPSGERVSSFVNDYCEEISLGGKLLGRIRLVRGYVRLFLPLAPSKYPHKLYHHKDYSRTPRYSACPLEIDICNAQTVRSAYSLIGEVMRLAGTVPSGDHIAKDFSASFDFAENASFDAFDYDDMAVADSLINDKDISDDYEEAPAVDYSAVASANGGGAEDGALPAGGRFMGITEAPEHVRMPLVAKVVDADGKKIGKVRHGIWYDLEGKVVGSFEKAEKKVHLRVHDARTAFVDKNDNVVALQGDYMATLRRFPVALVAILLAALIILTVISGVLSAHFMALSDSRNYAPELFIAEQNADGTKTSWADSENLSVFYNDQFGTEKVAPGMVGVYAFTLSNRNPHALDFSLEFACENEYNIGIVYTLYRDGVCLVGGDEKVIAEELSVYDMTIEPSSDSVFMLEWEWVHNDPVDTVAGMNNASYTLTISFTASVSGAEE